MEAVCKASAHQSTGLEKTITVFRGNASLGMTVSALRDGSGISIRSVVNGGAISKDGRLKVGDGILALNGEDTTNLTNAQARAMLRRHSLIGPELSVTYVPAAFLDMHRAIQSKHDVKASRVTAIQSKQELKLGQATGTQSKQEMKPGQSTVIQSKQEMKLGQATVIQSKQEMKPGPATVIQSKQEMKLGQANIIQSKLDKKMGRSTADQSLQGHKTPDTAFTKLGCIPEQSKVGGGRVSEKSCREREMEQAENTTHRERKDEQKREARGRTLSLQERGWRKEEIERETEDKRQRSGHPRRVTLIRTNGESLGISVIGGRGMGRRLSNGEMRRGIFIKHISDHSPAARDNTLTPGDQILQVGGVDVSDFTHEEAVEAIRQAGDKVELLVQNSQVSDLVTSNEEQSSQHNHLFSGNSPLKKPPKHPALPPLRLPSGPVSLLADGVTSKSVLERLHEPSENKQHCQQGQESYWGHMLQKYASLPGELKLVELDCSTHRCGLGVCVSEGRDGRRTVCVSEIRPDGAAAADGQISVGDELLEINGQDLYGQSYQTAAALINSASSKVKIVLIRNKAALKQTATGSIMEAENHTITSPLDVDIRPDKEHTHDATVTQEERMRLEKLKPCQSNNPPVSFIASSNHNPLPDLAPSFSHISPTSHVPTTSHNTAASHTHTIHHKQPYCSSLNSPSASGVQRSSYCSECSVRSDPLTCPIIPGCINIIDICKGHSSLGLTIVGGCNTVLGVILIHEVNEGGAAHRDGRLMAGDHILEVNGIDLRMASHEEALSVLRLSPQHVRLCVYRHTSTHTFPNQATHTHEDMWDLFTVDLQLQPGQELGLSIVGKRNDTGIFVSEIREGGVGESDGRLSLGDQILSVNGEDIRAVTQNYACSLLQKCSGSVLLEVARFRAAPHYSYECQVRNGM
ncbi:hypothetical protein KOW79_022512 [Hemibagrus wyckioides]|uniref:PDZ domain-containing protein n=1 Tax=Hemibagrus wyckioides TaxID=337641 RepID=A0A9D3S7F9_9TELE|nr:hypothetical protein KOW79_022512 [Hemibagrus wyckioides]